MFASLDRGGISERQIWRSDGTPEGTFLLEDLGPDGRVVMGLTSSMGGVTAFFAVGRSHSPGRSEVELWTTDGTPAGTRLLLRTFPY